ncbi:SET domain-containing protein [Paraglaciecola sp. MB-3u-78]|jgi:hypothetical protein|uniref:SET domain-containing protein n=1 Tax=Paraglaciecola sp. MB-3u-78 TaxID=2058332 RepID=UPI000C333B99|nr:SET domain-containing protein [Paraglaciecola sp. MB-3u-78]PKG99983.1 hypothetical protein CXF95_04860 [Paraglaciecola sp. MB-3u-78]
MVLPSLQTKWISDEKGYGLFATEFIPKGTVTYCQDLLDIVISPDELSKLPQVLIDSIHKFAFEPPCGNMVLSWDNAKYINHCCQPNSLSTGYEFEIAVRDVQADEELTTNYRLFSKHNTFQFFCDNSQCPRSPMNELPLESIDCSIKSALAYYEKVVQPLDFLVSPLVAEKLKDYLRGNLSYTSVAEQLPV